MERALQVGAIARRRGAVPRDLRVPDPQFRRRRDSARALPRALRAAEPRPRQGRNDRAGGLLRTEEPRFPRYPFLDLAMIAEPTTLLTDYALPGVTGGPPCALSPARQG